MESMETKEMIQIVKMESQAGETAGERYVPDSALIDAGEIHPKRFAENEDCLLAGFLYWSCSLIDSTEKPIVQKGKAPTLTGGSLHYENNQLKNREFSLNNPIYYYEQNK